MTTNTVSLFTCNNLRVADGGGGGGMKVRVGKGDWGEGSCKLPRRRILDSEINHVITALP